MKTATCLALMFSLLAVGCSTANDSSSESRSSTESMIDSQELREAYSEAFDEACEEIWANSPDGNLYYADVAYTEDECKDEKDETQADDASDVDEAAEQGREAGFDAGFELSPTGVLCYGEDCWTRADF